MEKYITFEQNILEILDSLKGIETEDINTRNIKDLTTYYDLSTSYIGDKTNKDDVKGKLRDNNFTCK